MATKKKATKRSTAARKKTAKKKTTASKKPAAKKSTKSKTGARKKTAAKKTARKKTTASKTARKKTTARKTAAKKPAARKTTKKSTAKKAAPAAKKVEAKKAAPVPPKKPVLVKPKNSATNQYTQSELFDCIQNYCGFGSRKEAKEFYENFAGMLHASLKGGYKIPLPGLGKLQVRRTKARMGINPATREPIKIPAKKKVAFTANKALKEAVL